MRRRSLIASACAAPSAAAAIRPGRAWPSRTPSQSGAVDLLLVLAVDVSLSIDEDDGRLQQEGYRSALADAAVLAAVQGGANGAIGLAYVEWAGTAFQRRLVPWTRIAGRADAEAWAARLAAAHSEAGSPYALAAGDASLSGTSIARGIWFSVLTLGEAPWQAGRRVIDVSGDGVDDGARSSPVEGSRDWAVEQGITINGLAIEGDPYFRNTYPGKLLADYYRDAVAGGPGAFVVAADGFGAFHAAVRRKLIREIAGLGVGPAPA
jgi:hypothetical protein